MAWSRNVSQRPKEERESGVNIQEEDACLQVQRPLGGSMPGV